MSAADEGTAAAGPRTHTAVATAPGGAALLLDVPPGWRLGDTARVAAVLARETSPSGFRTNAMVQVATVPASTSLDEVVAVASARFAATHDAVDERGRRPTCAGQAPGIVRLVCFDLGPQAYRLVQLQLFVDGGSCDAGPPEAAIAGRVIFTIGLTCAAIDLPELGEELAELVRSVRVQGTDPGSGPQR
jgi:hypothetical protein